ncbi:MAG: Gfo/Idh/MocA family oxidoreductase [Thaumarchaeota archaeon]|nr:MAG: Gfo/Idh/MocA family oxidoreductase [Nitrososphaerota archaeon]
MVRIAVIGIGGWGKNHVRVLNELDALAALCDANRERMQLYSKKYRVPGYESVDSLLKKEELDGVTICTPASTHFAIASKVLGEGLNTFVEKPMTTTSSDGESLIEMARKARKILTVGFIERFNPSISDLKKMFAEGRLGAPILLEFHRENRRGDVLDVGIVKDASVHDIDTARWLFGEEPRVVFARVGNVKSDNEDFAAIMMGFSEQRTAFITTNWVTPARVRTLEAVFENGVVNIDFVSQQTQVHEEDGTRMPRLVVQEPLMLELKEYLTAIEEKRQPLVRGEDGLMVTRIAEAVLASSRSGTPIFMKQ